MNIHEKLNYVELPATNIPSTKAFFTAVFGWEFEDYGPDYAAFSNEGLNGGFYQSELKSLVNNGSALLVFYSNALESTLAKVANSGGTITTPPFDFPGGRRFHFTEPSGNEFAVWSEQP